MASPQRIDANRINSQASSGPKTPQGKKRASLNAIKHGFTGRTVVYTEAELPHYESLCKDYREEFSPKGRLEADLVQELADLRWSLNGIRAREANLLALESVSGKLDIDTGDPDINSALAAAASLHENTKALATLSIYEQRKMRAFEKTLKQLKELQTERRQATAVDLFRAAVFAQVVQKTEPDWIPANDGFVCSSAELDLYRKRSDRQSTVNYVSSGGGVRR
jgi:hypothetical protein